MASIFVCPFCGSRKIRKEQEDDEDYCCDDCLEFFPEPKILTDEKPQKEVLNKMAIDKDKLKELHAAGKTDKEIAEALNAKYGTVFAARNSLGLKGNHTLQRSPRRSIDRPKPKELPTLKTIKPKTEKPLTDITAVDLLVAEKKQHQMAIIKIDQAIGILTA